MNLFKAYRCAKDKQFIAWVNIKRLMWYEGTIQLDPNGNQLMQLTESYYKDDALGGEWMNLSAEDEQQIVVLRAELCDMQKAKVKGQEHEKKSKKEKEAEKRGRGKKGKQAEKDKWAWKKVAP